MADQNKMILSELLAYVNTYLSKSGEFNLRLAVLQHYDVEEITNARSIMEASVKELIPTYPNFGKKRTDSVNRTAKEIMVNDITDMFKMLDKLPDRTDVPLFVAADLTKLPPASPETAADIMSVIETLARQERHIAQLQENMIATRKDVEKNRDDICEVGSKLTQASNKPSTSIANTRQSGDFSSREAQVAVSSDTSGDTSGSGDGEAGGSVTYSAAAKSASKKVIVASRRGPDDRGSTQGQSTDQQENGEGEFHKPVKRPNKGTNKSLGVSRQKPPRSSGTGNSDRLSAGPKSFQLQITNVGSDVSTKDIEDYIKTSSDNAIAAEKVEDLTGENWDTKRFIITLSYEHLNTVNDTAFWPKNIYFKRWFTARAKSS